MEDGFRGSGKAHWEPTPHTDRHPAEWTHRGRDFHHQNTRRSSLNLTRAWSIADGYFLPSMWHCRKAGLVLSSLGRPGLSLHWSRDYPQPPGVLLLSVTAGEGAVAPAKKMIVISE
jgi:hypothetical protein